jgi:hypothetical protein
MTIASVPLRMMLPAGDVARALYSEYNLSRRVRRLSGAHHTKARTPEQFFMRLAGFRSVTDHQAHAGVIKKLVEKPFEPVGHFIKKAVRPDLFPTVDLERHPDE